MTTTVMALLAALLSFIIGCVWVFDSAGMFVQYFYEARMVALTHVFTLGWVSLMIFGVLRQLAPLAFGVSLKRPAAYGASVALVIVGLVTMTLGFAGLNYTVAAAGTSLIFVAVVVLAVQLLPGILRNRHEPPHRHLAFALGYLLAAAFLGGWMGVAKGLDVPLPAPFHRVLFAHIHLAGAGWAGLTIFAVLSRLFPQPHLNRPRFARLRFAAFNAGLIGLTAGLLAPGGWYAPFGALLALACVAYAVEFVPVIRRFGTPADRSTAFLVASWICLAAVSLLGLWFTVSAIEPMLAMRLQFAYGFLYMFGWLSLMILGMLYRIMPTHISKFLTARGVRAGEGVRQAFVDPDLQIVVLACLLAGLAVAVFGIVAPNVMAFRIGWGIWLTGIIGFMGGVARLGIVLRRILRRPDLFTSHRLN